MVTQHASSSTEFVVVAFQVFKKSGMNTVHVGCIVHITGIKQTSEHSNVTGASYNKFKLNRNIFKKEWVSATVEDRKGGNLNNTTYCKWPFD